MMRTVLLLIFIFAFGVSQIDAGCFSRSFCDLRINNNCYVHIDEAVNWTQAESCCVAWGGHLASIHSDGENYFLNSIRNEDRFTWIGLNDKAQEGTFVWTDGTSNNYNKFAQRQPDNANSEHCVHFHPKWRITVQEWNDITCSITRWETSQSSYICQKSMCPNLLKSRCDLVQNGKCYIFGEKDMNWHTAETCCREWGGHLASIHSDLENYAINSIRNKTHRTWIGLNDDVREGTFEWTDGTPHDYENFARRQPTNAGGSENCIQILPNSLESKWNNGCCSYVAKSFVCKKDYALACPEHFRRQRSVMETEVVGV